MKPRISSTRGFRQAPCLNRHMKLIIEPGRTAKNYWRDLWQYRELMYFLAWRDIAVRYKQTIIGVAWALIRPALTMLVFVGFRRMAGFPRVGVPEPILVFAAVLPWQFFSTALSESAGSLIGNANLISKVYFPRLIIPCAAVVTSLVDFLITLGLLAALMVWYGFMPGWQLGALPFFVLLAFGLSLGFGLLLAALNVEYRDFRYIVPFIVQFGTVRIADCIQHGGRARDLAHALRSQSDGRRHRRLPVVAPRRPRAARSPQRGAFGGDHRFAFASRRVVLPPHGAQLRRRDLTVSDEFPAASDTRFSTAFPEQPNARWCAFLLLAALAAASGSAACHCSAARPSCGLSPIRSARLTRWLSSVAGSTCGPSPPPSTTNRD